MQHWASRCLPCFQQQRILTISPLSPSPRSHWRVQPLVLHRPLGRHPGFLARLPHHGHRVHVRHRGTGAAQVLFKSESVSCVRWWLRESTWLRLWLWLSSDQWTYPLPALVLTPTATPTATLNTTPTATLNTTPLPPSQSPRQCPPELPIADQSHGEDLRRRGGRAVCRGGHHGRLLAHRVQAAASHLPGEWVGCYHAAQYRLYGSPSLLPPSLPPPLSLTLTPTLTLTLTLNLILTLTLTLTHTHIPPHSHSPTPPSSSPPTTRPAPSWPPSSPPLPASPSP